MDNNKSPANPPISGVIPTATPTPSGPPPGDSGVVVDRSVSGTLDFERSAGEYDLRVQISISALEMGQITSEKGNYTLEPLFAGVRSVGP